MKESDSLIIHGMYSPFQWLRQQT